MPTIKKLELCSYDATPDGSVKITSLLKYFQQIARDDLLGYGVSYNSMREANQVFVIIKLRIEFKKNISVYDELFLETVPTKVSGITFFRDFFIRDCNGNVLAECSTAWVLMDYVARRILRPNAIITPVPEFPDRASNVTLSRHFQFSDSPISSKTNVRKIYFSNLDENNHFNNAETAAFAIDEFSERIIGGEKVKIFEIHFNHESMLNDELHITCENRTSSCFVSAENPRFETNAFQCFCEF